MNRHLDKQLNTMIAQGWSVRSNATGEYRRQITDRLLLARDLAHRGEKEKAIATLREIRGVAA